MGRMTEQTYVFTLQNPNLERIAVRSKNLSVDIEIGTFQKWQIFGLISATACSMFCDDILALASVESYMLLIFRVFVVCFGVIKSRKHVQRNSMKLVDLKQFLWCSLSSCMISRSSVTAEFERENKPRRRCFFEDPSNLPVFFVFFIYASWLRLWWARRSRIYLPGFFCLSCFVAFRLSESEVFGHGLRTDKRWSVRLQALGLHLNACI